MVRLLQIVLTVMWLANFALALGLTLISFQSYRQEPSDRLESAFIGFAFLAMGVGLTNLSSQVESYSTVFRIVQSVPFIVGFSMLYASLFR